VTPIRQGEPLLTVRGLSLAYANGSDPFWVLQDLSFTVEEGSFVAILGPSGCGKSTLLRVLAGLLPATQGEVRFDGRPLNEPHPDIGLVFQYANLLPWRTVLENITLPLEIRGIPAPLDALTREQMWGELLRLWSHTRVTIVMVTHSMTEALVLADRVLVLSPRPARLRLTLDVPFPRPRTEDIRYTATFGTLVQRIREAILKPV